MKNPAHVEELAELNCANPDCQNPDCSQILVLVPLCHPGAGTQTEYHKSDGTVRIACHECERPIMSIKVASLPREKMQ